MQKILITSFFIFLIIVLVGCGVFAMIFSDAKIILFSKDGKPVSSYSDKMMAKEMTNAIERFNCEYLMYYRDIKLKTINFDDMDDMQKRLYNITSAKSVEDIKVFEKLQLDGDTKNVIKKEDIKHILQEYILTESLSFTPTQPEFCYWYSYECGVIVVANKNSSVEELNNLVPSQTTAHGQKLSNSIKWINISL